MTHHKANTQNSPYVEQDVRRDNVLKHKEMF